MQGERAGGARGPSLGEVGRVARNPSHQRSRVCARVEPNAGQFADGRTTVAPRRSRRTGEQESLRDYLENRSIAVCAALIGRAIKRALRIFDEGRVRLL